MRPIRFLSVVLALIFALSTAVQSQTVKKKPVYSYWSISPVAGVAFPVGKFGENFKTGPIFGLDVSYRINKEVGIYAEGGYYIFSSKIDGVSDSK